MSCRGVRSDVAALVGEIHIDILLERLPDRLQSAPHHGALIFVLKERDVDFARIEEPVSRSPAEPIPAAAISIVVPRNRKSPSLTSVDQETQDVGLCGFGGEEHRRRTNPPLVE